MVTGIPGKTGIIYTLDLKTGEFLWARPTVMQNVVEKIDGATGKVTVNPATVMNKDGDSVFVCPTASGGKDFQAGAYSPRTNIMYYGLANLCMQVTSVNNTSAYQFNSRSSIAPGTQNVGTLFAVSAGNGQDGLETRPTRGHDVIAGHGGRGGFHRRRERSLPGVQRSDRRGVVGWLWATRSAAIRSRIR
ncbi:MAG: hypothetical protein WDO18_07775 [Acidobacteriota bacterium]